MVTNWGAYKNPEMYSHTVLETWLKSRAVLPLKALRGGVGGSCLHWLLVAASFLGCGRIPPVSASDCAWPCHVPVISPSLLL